MIPGLSQSKIHSFNKYLPEIYFVWGTVSGTGNKTLNKTKIVDRSEGTQTLHHPFHRSQAASEQAALSWVLPYSRFHLAPICSALKYCDANYKSTLSSDISLTIWGTGPVHGGTNLICKLIKIKTVELIKLLWAIIHSGTISKSRNVF